MMLTTDKFPIHYIETTYYPMWFKSLVMKKDGTLYKYIKKVYLKVIKSL